MQFYGIKSQELKWFESYLFDRKHYVSFDGVRSEACSISCVVPQGSILDPLLFVLLINDIELQIKQSKIILNADDAVIYYANKDIDIILGRLNDDLNRIANWFSENNFENRMCPIWYPSFAVFAIRDQNKWNSDN